MVGFVAVDAKRPRPLARLFGRGQDRGWVDHLILLGVPVRGPDGWIGLGFVGTGMRSHADNKKPQDFGGRPESWGGPTLMEQIIGICFPARRTLKQGFGL